MTFDAIVCEGVIMKKQYSMQLESVAVEKLDELLKNTGMRRSTFVNLLITKTVDAMDLSSIPDLKKITLPEALQMLGGLGKMMAKIK